jgi:radical SAM protein with 4Fe4S-binding SPASM domain
MLEPFEFPTHIDMDPSSRCNLSCSFCHLSFFDPKESEDLSFENFMKLVPLFSHLKKVTLFSKFEPLMCRDFEKIFLELAKLDIELYFSTNGIMLNEKIIDLIVGRLDYLTISVTGFTNEKYRQFMGKDSLQNVNSNLELLNAKKRLLNTDKPRLRISTVWMKDTISDLPNAVDFAALHKANEGIQVTSFIAYDKKDREQIPLVQKDDFADEAKKAKLYAEEKSIALTFQSGEFEENQDKTEKLGHAECMIPWRRLSIQSNGDVYPCPVAYKPIGNFFTTDIMSIWNGEEMNRFRRGVNVVIGQNDECARCVHCRHKSIVDEGSNDFSDAKKYIAGMTRKI